MRKDNPMSNFESDVKLLAALDAEIKALEATANPPEMGVALLNTVLPGVGKMMPFAQKNALKKIETFQQIRNRLAELIEKDHEQ